MAAITSGPVIINNRAITGINLPFATGYGAKVSAFQFRADHADRDRYSVAGDGRTDRLAPLAAAGEGTAAVLIAGRHCAARHCAARWPVDRCGAAGRVSGAVDAVGAK